MLSEKQLNIFEIFITNIYKKYTYKEIKGINSSNNFVQLSIKKFKEENLIDEEVIGTSKLYFLNLKNPVVYLYIDLVINSKSSKDVLYSIDILKKEIEKFTLFYSLVIFGSYVKNQNKKNSDLDIAIFINNNRLIQKIKVAINLANNKSLLTLDIHIFTKKDFLKLLKADYSNLAKEIVYNNRPIHNSVIFYKILERGVNNGFKIIS